MAAVFLAIALAGRIVCVIVHVVTPSGLSRAPAISDDRASR
jgi:hypothetical protein